MPHRRSRTGLLRRVSKSLVRLHAQFDREKWETISTMDQEDPVSLFSKRLRDIPLAAVLGIERG
jgi:hypothetical protein